MFKLNATKNNIKNLIISAIVLAVILVLFLVIGLRAKISYANGDSVSQTFIGFSGYNWTDGRYGLNIFNNISQLGVDTNTKIIFPAVIIIICLGAASFIMSLLGFAIKEQYKVTKVVFDVLTKLYLFLIVILSIVIIAQFSTYTHDYNNRILKEGKEGKVNIDILTWVFMIIFGMVFPLLAIIINFNKRVYRKRK